MSVPKLPEVGGLLRKYLTVNVDSGAVYLLSGTWVERGTIS